jgi:hypothetical protein
VTALCVHPVTHGLCIAGFQNGLLVAMDLRCSEQSVLTNVDAPSAGERILRIAGNLGDCVSFYAGTQKGSILTWDKFGQWGKLRTQGPTLVDFDVHKVSPLMVFTPVQSAPVLCDLQMKTVKQVRNVEFGSICALHPRRPLIAFGSPSGDVIEFEIVPGR